MFFNNKYKRIISIFLVVTFLVPSLLLTQPKETNAGLPVTDVGNTAVNIASKILEKLQVGYQALSEALEWADNNKEFVLDGIAWQIAKMAIRQMTTSIVNWINSGFEGNPLFVTDFEGMMTDIADGVIGEYIYGNEKLKFLCSPFSLQIKMSLYNTFYGGRDAFKCTLSDVINNAGGALQSLEDDFRWGTWIEMTNKESNNVYGVFLDVEEEILEKITGDQGIKIKQADWGRGILSWEECETFGIGANAKKHCITKTPGSVIESQLNKNLDSGRESLITADEINEIIGALFMQLIKGVMGPTGLINQKPSSKDNKSDLNSIKTEIIKGIDLSLKDERKYNEIKNDSLDYVINAKDQVNQLIDCLNITGEVAKLNLANRFLTESETIPQTKIRIDLKSKEEFIRQDIIKSDEYILDLNKLIERTNKASSTNQLNNISIEYSELRQEIHRLKDISDATIERDGYGADESVGLEMGLNWKTDTLINIFAKTISTEAGDVAPPESDKGILQRHNECLVKKQIIESSGGYYYDPNDMP